MSKFKNGLRVKVSECYLQDEVCQNTETTSNATICSTPQDEEELVMIQYDNGFLDIVPQYILELI